MRQKSPQGASRLLARAVELRHQRKLGEAEALLRQVLRGDGRCQPALHLLGILRLERGDSAEARSLLERAVMLAPGDLDAWRNLGHACHASGVYDQAQACFRRVLQAQPLDVAARGSLAVALEKSGHVDAAIDELQTLIKLVPRDDTALRLLARLLRQARRHEEEVEIARELLRLFPGEEVLREALARSYFLWFDSVDREPEKARRVLAEWLEFFPEDPVARHMQAAQEGREQPSRAADAYVERHFDEFAGTFDQVLGSLDYRGPALMLKALELSEPTPKGALDAADLGCGTGLCGPLVRPWVRSLVGVDLSRKMLDLAGQRGCYERLVHQEVTAFVQQSPGAFDLLLCAETLPYFGDVSELFAGVAGALHPGGRFIATIELLAGEQDFSLHSAGRYAHSAGYVTGQLARAGLRVERTAVDGIRVEYGKTVEGMVVTARAPG